MFLLLAKNANAVLQGCITRVKHDFYQNFICYSKVQQLQLLSQSIHAQTDYTPKHTCNSTITTQGMPTVILQVLFKKEETNHFCKRRKTN